ncbi:MAG: aminotransferase class V-fold PLP-dependent enzyme [Burkholderiales bacterium]|nr:aminotransferase class V-fold PLP-dependent enzyme [Burkholderiales bacterium]
MTNQPATLYLDNNATTALAPECLEPMLACLRDVHGNPSSKHAEGARAKELVEQARGAVARLLNVTAPEIVFTASGTEANHLAITGALGVRTGKFHVVLSAVEHPANLRLIDHLESEGVRVTYAPVDSEGRIDLMQLERSITPDTALVSVMWANNETGVLFPVEEVARIAKARDALLHVDAVQAIGKLPVDLTRIPVDLLSLSGHKFHGPKGAGALFVRKKQRLQPMLFGHQERGRRGGTENVPAIVGLGVASEIAAKDLAAKSAAMAALRDRFEAGVLRRIPFASINGGMASRVCNTSSIRFGELEGEAILDKLDRAGICASSGAACTAGGSAPSHVLSAMGLSEAEARATIRFSLSRYTTEKEIDQVLNVLGSIIHPMTAVAA